MFAGILVSKTMVNHQNNSSVTLTVTEFMDKYQSKQGKVKGGSLCFYGHWFGRPLDNWHQLEMLTFDKTKNVLTLKFHENGILTLFNPKDISESPSILTIQSADKIYWEWFSYGKLRTDDYVYYIEINCQGNVLTGKSNRDLYNPEITDLNITNPALVWG